jgi:hypothetical protein
MTMDFDVAYVLFWIPSGDLNEFFPRMAGIYSTKEEADCALRHATSVRGTYGTVLPMYRRDVPSCLQPK